MADFLSGLKKFGLGNLKSEELYEDPKKKKVEVEKPAAKAPVKIVEKDLLYDKKYTCPICDKEFVAKTVRTGKVRMKGVDLDLRPDYDEIDQIKYDVIACPECGYAALARYYGKLTKFQIDEIKSKICANYRKQDYLGEVYSYEEAQIRYELALATAMVKKSKNSEKAYLCLKTAWLIRGEVQRMDPDEPNYEKLKAEKEAQEKDLLKNALEGFIMARQSEEFPIAGMDSNTLDYLMAALATETDDFDVANKMISELLTSRAANERIKDKARALKEMIAEKKAGQ
jgi:uncharacterized protein (DUF2225 family)